MTTVIETINKKISTRDEEFTICTYDNGYLIQISGRDSEDHWSGAKVFVSTIDEVKDVVGYILTSIPLNS